MSKKKKKSEPFDNSISNITIVNRMCHHLEEIHCPDCKTNLLFMYARRRTDDEIWLCRICKTLLIIKIEVKIYIRLKQELEGKENGN